MVAMLGREDLIAAARKLWGEPTSKRQVEWRFGTHGSKSIDLVDLIWHDHEANTGGGVVELVGLAGLSGNGHDPVTSAWVTYDYRDERGALLFQVVRKPGHKFSQRRPEGAGWVWNLKGTRRVIYRLPQLLGSDGLDPVFICEGEKDADNLARLGFVTTTNPGGAGKWRGEYSVFLSDRDCTILPDLDTTGIEHAAVVERLLYGHAHTVKIIRLPGLTGEKNNKDVSDWIARGGTAEALRQLVAATPVRDWGRAEQTTELPMAVEFSDFLYYSRENKYIFLKDGSLWPAKAVDLRLPWIGGTKPSTIIARDHPVEQMTWSPGEPRLVKHKLIDKGGWIESPNATVFNAYRPPKLELGNADNAEPWVEHVRRVYPGEAEHIIQWLAHRAQYPQIKINHALVLSGEQGIGKDSLLAPAIHTVGFWNVETVSPAQVLGRFNGHLKSVILVVSEARDLGEVNRPQFYEHLKVVIVAPPNVLKVDEKNTHEYYIPNLTGVVITTNHKAGGIFLAPDDRRHLIAWSNETYTSLGGEAYFDGLWDFYLKRGGLDAVAAYLLGLDVTGFDPYAPPPKTEAFWEIVAASAQPEVHDLTDILTRLGNPPIVVLNDLISVTSGTEADLVIHLKDRANRRMIPRWMEQVGYKTVRNPESKQGLWNIDGKQQVAYGISSWNINKLHKEIQVRMRRKFS
jgi:hypothetical protein